jgi:hypothetical protein
VHRVHQVRHQVARVRQERKVLQHLRDCIMHTHQSINIS